LIVVRRAFGFFIAALACILAVAAAPARAQQAQSILNVSFDPTRELFAAINPVFTKYWEASSGTHVDVKQSHAGSGKQARSVIDGLEADVVTLALAYDIDAISTKGDLIPADWRMRLPNNSAPFTSTIVFLVRKGNPRDIKDWADLVKPGVKVVSPNPKTSGGARWNYLAAWGYALRANKNDEAKAREFVKGLFANISVLDTGARGATNTFAQRHIGDVLIGWESDALLVRKECAAQEFEIIYPSVSIEAEPPVAVVEKVASKHGTLAAAKAYLEFLYTDQAQEIVAASYFRPRSKPIAEKHAATFATIPLFTVDEVFGGWDSAHAKHFAEGGTFDKIQAELAEKKP
jgi:sulfate transport system substrate-binding protein